MPNKVKLNNPFSRWLKSLGDEKKMQSEFEKHLIPQGKWSVKNYDDFIKERKKLIEKKFKKLLR